MLQPRQRILIFSIYSACLGFLLFYSTIRRGFFKFWPINMIFAEHSINNGKNKVTKKT